MDVYVNKNIKNVIYLLYKSIFSEIIIINSLTFKQFLNFNFLKFVLLFLLIYLKMLININLK